MNIITTLIEGELTTLRIGVGKYDEVTKQTSYGTSNVNIGAKDIYVKIIDCESNSITPVITKQRVSGTATPTGSIAIDEDTSTKSNLDIIMQPADYEAWPAEGKFNTHGRKSRRFELFAEYKVSTTDRKPIYPYVDPVTKELIRYYIDLIQSP